MKIHESVLLIFSLIFIKDSETGNNVTITLKHKDEFEDKYFVPDKKFLSESDYLELQPGVYVFRSNLKLITIIIY